MGKDSALGHDPLKWMKVTNENKKPFSLEDANATSQNTGKGDQEISSQATFKQQIPFPISNDKTPNNTEISQPFSKVNGVFDNTVTPKPKVVIGRLYEKPSIEKIKSEQRNEGMFQEARHSNEPSFPSSRTMQPIKRMEPQINHIPVPGATSINRLPTYIIIAYTALLLILGGLVYNDLSKRTSRVEAKIFAIEKALRLKQ